MLLPSLSVVLLACSAWATPLIPNLGEKIGQELEKRQAGTFAITGIRDGQIIARQEMRQMQRNADLWNIYLLGLQRMQAQPQSNPLSWYQIAGIHGRPFGAWDGVGAGNGLGNNGYCTHASNLFATWHRPYLALFEQSLYANILDAVNSFPAGSSDRQRYSNAARQFRMPYLDWAAAPASGQSVLPISVTSPGVTVRTPSGTQTINNPLYSYRFHPADGSLGSSPFNGWSSTLRYPTNRSPTAQSQNSLAQQQFDRNRISFRDRLYQLFTVYTNFNQFSNEAWLINNAGNFDSMESVHDGIHGIAGNGGHMSYIDVAAFDPLFWLHHTMVDRCVALWQAVNPNSYILPANSLSSTYTIQAGQVEDVNSPLTPFHYDNAGHFWTSNGVRYTQTLGYTYPELTRGSSQASVVSTINALYGPNAFRTTKRDTNDTSAHPAPGSTTREYIANIKSERFGLGSSYFVYIFIGNYTTPPERWALDPNLVGTHVVFSHEDSSSSDAHAMSGLLVTGTVPLTTVLKQYVAAGKLASLKKSDVLPFLKDNLLWTVAKVDDTPVPVDQVPGLVVSVGGAAVKLPKVSTQLPVRLTGFEKYTDVTDDKSTGASPGDDD